MLIDILQNLNTLLRDILQDLFIHYRSRDRVLLSAVLFIMNDLH